MFTRLSRFFKAIFNAILGEAEGQIPVRCSSRPRGRCSTTCAPCARRRPPPSPSRPRPSAISTPRAPGSRTSSGRPRRRSSRATRSSPAARCSSRSRPRAPRNGPTQTFKAAKVRADNARAKLKIEEERVQGKIRQLGELKAVHAMNEAQRRMQDITDEYNIDGAVSVFDKTAGSIQEQADKLSAMDTIAVSEGEDLDRQLAADQQEERGRRRAGGAEGPPGRGSGRRARPPRPPRRRRSPRPSTEK